MCCDFSFIIVIHSFASCLRIYPGRRRVEVEIVYNRILWRYTHMSCLHGIARWKFVKG